MQEPTAVRSTSDDVDSQTPVTLSDKYEILDRKFFELRIREKYAAVSASILAAAFGISLFATWSSISAVRQEADQIGEDLARFQERIIAPADSQFRKRAGEFADSVNIVLSARLTAQARQLTGRWHTQVVRIDSVLSPEAGPFGRFRSAAGTERRTPEWYDFDGEGGRCAPGKFVRGVKLTEAIVGSGQSKRAQMVLEVSCTR